jgi:hypothetical protein
VCEYCQRPSAWEPAGHAFQIDHIIAEKHGGKTVSENLALACIRCNSYKGPNIAGIDPLEGRVVSLYHPRRDRWDEHFRWNGPVLVGVAPEARATIEVLAINHPASVAFRASLIAEGVFPPE